MDSPDRFDVDDDAPEPVEHGSFQVIILGGGGGPSEDNVTGILVRAVHARWSKNSILAVDAGVHLSSIVKILKRNMPKAVRFTPKSDDDLVQIHSVFSPVRQTALPALPNGTSSPRPFAPSSRVTTWGIKSSPAVQADAASKFVQLTGPFKHVMLPCETAKANAQHLMRSLISTYLITHPHLDHLAGFAINTAAFHATSRPKKIAALPQTIDAIKTNIFNDIIWPNMSDEEGGIGFISYTRLIEGGNVALGEGEGRGYIEVCEGLEVKSRSVSHGHCMKTRPQRSNSQDLMQRRASRADYMTSPDMRRGSMAYFDYEPRQSVDHCVIDSTAFFIRAEATGDEILVFGDVEPDSLSLLPRNSRVWADAASKIASGLLKAVFIECSYPDSQTDETLFGHLAPRHLVAELAVLAEYVESARVGMDNNADGRMGPPLGDLARKRKRQTDSVDAGRLGRGGYPLLPRSRTSRSLSPTAQPQPEAMDDEPVTEASLNPHRRPTLHARGMSRENMPSISVSNALGPKPLEGLKVVIIHIKDNLLDSPNAAEVILTELRAHEQQQNLGVEFVVPQSGGFMYL